MTVWYRDLPRMRDSFAVLEGYEAMVRGFTRRNRRDAVLDTAAILTCLGLWLPLVWLLRAQQLC